MDGARLMNAAVALDIEPREIVQYVDMVTMSFSKVDTLYVLWSDVISSLTSCFRELEHLPEQS